MKLPPSLEFSDDLICEAMRFRVIGPCGESKLNLITGKAQVPAANE